MVETLPCYGCFTTSMGSHFPTVEMDNMIRFSIVSDPLKGHHSVASFQMVLPVWPVIT